MTVSLADQIKDVGREIGMRKAVYPKWIVSGKMSQDTADKQLAAMSEVYATLKWLEANKVLMSSIGLDPENRGGGS